MKIPINFFAAAALVASTPSLLGDGHGDPFTPLGTLDIGNQWVRGGANAHLTWDIAYPLTVPDLVIPQPGGTVITKEPVRVRIRLIGVAFQSGDTEMPARFWTKVGVHPWVKHFEGTGSEVQPGQYIYDAVVPTATTIDFQAQGKMGGNDDEWHDVRSTLVSDIAVIGLLNGDTPPAYAPAYEQGSIESFLSSYINGSNQVVVGPRDMIYLFELASRDPGDWWFDMQDVVVIVTFDRVNGDQYGGNGNNS